MYKKCEQSFETYACSHQHTVEDFGEGTVVCTGCGLVIDDQIYIHPFPFDSCTNKTDIVLNIYSKKMQNNEELRIMKVSSVGKVMHFIKEVAARAHIPDVHVDYAYNLYGKLSSELAKTKYSFEEIAAFSIYETLIRHRCPRSPEEVHAITGVPTRTLWKIEHQLLKITKHSANMPATAIAEDYIFRFCDMLSINYYVALEIRHSLTQKYFGLNHLRPYCLAAFAILTFCCKSPFNKSVREISEVCNVSSATLYRLKRMYSK